MLRQQRRQRQPSRFDDFVDLPPQQKRSKRITQTTGITKPPVGLVLQQHTSDSDRHSSRPTGKRAVVSKPKVGLYTEQPTVLEEAGPLRDNEPHLYVCPEELVALSGPERIQYLQNRLHHIRTYYASLKSEVESIDRRRKRMKKKRRRDGSTTAASASVSPGSSDISSGSSPSHNTHRLSGVK